MSRPSLTPLGICLCLLAVSSCDERTGSSEPCRTVSTVDFVYPDGVAAGIGFTYGFDEDPVELRYCGTRYSRVVLNSGSEGTFHWIGYEPDSSLVYQYRYQDSVVDICECRGEAELVVNFPFSGTTWEVDLDSLVRSGEPWVELSLVDGEVSEGYPRAKKNNER